MPSWPACSDLFLRALKGEKTPRPPVWLMRQAGRYLPEYQELRRKHTLGELFHTPKLAAHITLQPVHRLKVDAAILFADILLIAETCGKSVHYPPSGGPKIDPLSTAEIAALRPLPVRRTLSYVYEAVGRIKEMSSLPLIGFCGGPFTVASYMLGNVDMRAPQPLHRLLDVLTNQSIEYLHAQIDAGVDAVQIFDSWANRLSDTAFEALSLPYLARIVGEVQSRVPVILFCRGASARAQALAALKPAAISATEEKPMSLLRQEIPPHIALQGNLMPELLLRSEEEIAQEVRALLHAMRDQSGFIVNLSHGVLPQTPVAHVERFVREVQESS